MEQQQPTPTQTVVVISKQKSVGAAFALAFFFGPLGLLYASVAGGITMILLGIVITFVTLGFGIIIVWVVSIVWAMVAVNMHNKKAAKSVRI